MKLTSEKLSSLREAMKENQIDIYLIPSTDPHLGEYVPEHWRIIRWLTGFTGSSAVCAVTDAFAGLWTDSRYFLQAENQLENSGFVLMKSTSLRQDLQNWIVENADKGSKIGFDDRLFSIEWTRNIEKAFQNVTLSNCDLISMIWTDRPVMPHSLAFTHDISFCGRERSEKIDEVRKLMKIRNIDYQLLTSNDDIMWLLNIRGSEIKFSPLLISFAIIGQEQILLFVEENKIPFKLASEFDRLDIVILPYEETAGMVSTLSADSTILINPATTSRNFLNALRTGITVIEDLTIPTRLKAIKNRTEIDNIRKAMVKDGIALTKLFFWLEKTKEMVSEVSIGEKLDSLRSENENFTSTSFSTIVAWNEHGALPHYSADPESDLMLGKNGILLIDSGGQYFEGTTDITRTIAIGKPGKRQKHDFTLVLKGMINLASARFPDGTKGYQLDVLARKFLWENGLNYGHGTGHGVGFFLNVHEGPQNISPVPGSDSKVSIQPGMLISDEPAIYREGEYGIRIENLILCSEDTESVYGKFLKFETVSLCYIDKSLIEVSLLDEKEIDWLNSYHAEVYKKLSPHLSEDERDWLKDKTSNL